jgi:hypothetical protein
MAELINPYSFRCGRNRGLPPRWHVVRTYRSEAGPIEVVDDIEELFELDHLVEHGPHWDTLVDIRITLNTPCYPELTIEGSERL